MTTIVPAIETLVTVVSQNYPQNKVTVAVENDLNPTHTIVVENTYFPYIVYFTGNDELGNKRYISQWLYDRLITGTSTVPGEYSFDIGKILHSLDQEVGIYPYYPLNWAEFTASYKEQLTKTPDYAGDDVTINGQTVLEAEGAILGAFDVTPEYILTWLDFPIKNNNGFPIDNFPPLLSYGHRSVYSITYGKAIFESDEGKYEDDTVIITMGEISTTVDSIDAYNARVAELTKEGNFKISTIKKETIRKLENASKSFSLEEALARAAAKANELLGKGDSLLAKAGELSNSAKLLQAKFQELNKLKAGLTSMSKLPIIKLSKIVVDAAIKRKIKKNIIRKPKIKGSRNFPYTVSPTASKKILSKADRVNAITGSYTTYDDSPITPNTIKFISDSIDYADRTKAMLYPANSVGDTSIDFGAPGTLVSKIQEKRQKLSLPLYDIKKLPYYDAENLL